MAFDPQIYKNISYDHLVTHCVFSLQKTGGEVTFEELVKECFENFPERFKLFIPNRNWPDTTLIDKSWLRARTDKRWIVGSRSAGFRLTPAGYKIAEIVARQLGKEDKIMGKGKELISGEQTRSARITRQVLNSEAFNKYKGGLIDSISEYEFCESIFSTLDSPPDVKRKNFQLVKQYAQQARRPEIIEYLEKASKKFPQFFISPKGFKGGMMKKKL